MDAPGLVRYGVERAVATITLARPGKRNALDEAMFRALGDAVDSARSEETARVIVVRGEGPSFCAGIDLSMLASLAGATDEDLRRFVVLAQRPCRALTESDKPSVAVVQGSAVGAGFQLALACDLRVATPRARFAMPEGRFGLIPDLGGVHRLALLIGIGRAKDLTWTGRGVDAGEALRIGLVDRLALSEDPASELEELLEELMAFSPTAQRLTKRLIEGAHSTPIGQEFEMEAQAQAAAVAGEDHREAVAAFLERRSPRFARPSD